MYNKQKHHLSNPRLVFETVAIADPSCHMMTKHYIFLWLKTTKQVFLFEAIECS